MGIVQDKQNTHQQAKANKQPANAQRKAAHKGVPTELSAKALHNLTGWFDVLIQMDLAQKVRNEIRSKEDGQQTEDKNN